ncbi:MAG TPA: EAL domain-containing protein [Thioploca sp.]|nr:EAL domain-containing protein [Thioploca sp.]
MINYLPKITSSRVLVVDDDEINRLLIRETLQQSGLLVEEVESGEEAIEHFRKNPSDIILLDVIMEGIDGFETCSSLRQLPTGLHVPIVMMTGLNDIKSITYAYKSGATDFITKPINYTILAYRMRYMLRANQVFNRLYSNETRLRKTQEIAKLGYWEWNIKQNTFYISKQALKILGLSDSANLQHPQELLNFILQEERESIHTYFSEALHSNKDFVIEHKIITSDNIVKNIYQEAELQQDSNGQEQWIVTIQDITERKKTEAKIVRLAYYDHLTSLPNKVFLNEYLTKIIDQSKCYNQIFAILSIDIDHFKRINSSWGQKTGNELLQQIAARITKCIRTSDYLTRGNLKLPEQACYQPNKSDTLIRLGGDEFVLLLTDINSRIEVQPIIQRIYKVLQEPFITEKENCYLTISTGIAMYPNDGQDTDTLLMQAEMAMHNAKQQGRNNFQFFHKSMNTQVRQRLILENELHKAIEREEFEVYYQPKIELTEYKTVGMEALVRWNHPEKGIISPVNFISLAEETDLICLLGEWVLQQACKHTKYWHKQGFILKVAVNLSTVQLKKPDILENIRKALQDNDLPAEYLELEITEGVLIEDYETSYTILSEIKKIGVYIAIDDFGTGYSSLSYLKKFPFDTLKIDQSFIRDLATDPDSSALTSAIIALSTCLNLKVVAEGIETNAQLDFMKKHQCDEIQGYLFSPPLSYKDFDNWLRNPHHPD